MRKSWHERSLKEAKELFEIWPNESESPFLLSLEDLLNLSEKIKISQRIIEDSSNPRLIVLETWLIIDFTIRHLLTVGLELARFESDNLTFLPPNTRDCIKMLQDLIRDQSNKPINPSRKGIMLPGEFLSIIQEDHDFFKKFLMYNDQYDEKVDVHYNGATSNQNNPNYRNVSENWFNTVSKLDTVWFKSIEKINKVRNNAAHSFDEEKIFLTLGINGKNKLEKLKKYCNKNLVAILGLKE